MFSNTGTNFEKRVFEILHHLVDAGLAKELRRQKYVKDRDGNTRKIDLSVVLCTNLVDLLVSIECKRKRRSLSLDDVDQIKTFKRELPVRNLFWLVYDGVINDSVRRALQNNGISAYSGDELERIVTDVVNTFRSSAGAINQARSQIRHFSVMDTYMQSHAENGLHSIIAADFRAFDDVWRMFSAEASRMHQQIEEMWAPPYAKFSDNELKPFLQAVNSPDPEGWLVRLLIDFKDSGGTEEDAEAILEWLKITTGDGADERYDVISKVEDYLGGWEDRAKHIFEDDFNEEKFYRQLPPKGARIPESLPKWSDSTSD